MRASRRNLIRYLIGSSLFPSVALAGQSRGWKSLPKKGVSRLAFGSCALQWEPQPVWKTVVEKRPDVFLFLGDNIYGDWHGEKAFVPTAESLRKDYAALAAKPEFSVARDRIPFLATWDNHDYGKHDGGVEFEGKEIARRELLDFFGEAEDSVRRTRDGIYDACILGPKGRRAQIILLDGRWNRSPLVPDTRTKEERGRLGLSGSMGHTPNTDTSATLLGDNQWNWLEEQLRKPAEIRFICSGTQVVNDTKGMQEWGNFPAERARLFRLIESTGAKGVIFLSGNVHYSELCVTAEGPYPLFDFTSSGMTHNNETYAAWPNPYRIAGPYTGNSFGLLEIDWEADAGPDVACAAIGLDGRVKFSHRIPHADIRP